MALKYVVLPDGRVGQLLKTDSSNNQGKYLVSIKGGGQEYCTDCNPITEDAFHSAAIVPVKTPAKKGKK